MRIAIVTAILATALGACEDSIQDVRKGLTARCLAVGGDVLEYPRDAPAIRVNDPTDIMECVRREPDNRKVVAVYVVTGPKGNRTWDERLASSAKNTKR